MMWAEHFKRDSEPYKKSGAFELKIGSRICSLYDYGTHLLRMYKKAVSFEDFKRNNYVTFNRLDGITVYEGITEKQMTMQEFNDYTSKHLRSGGMRYRCLTMTVQEFMEMFVDPDAQHIQIWSDAGEKIVYDGDYGDVPEHMNYAEVSSIDNVYADNKGVICLNVWSVN